MAAQSQKFEIKKNSLWVTVVCTHNTLYYFFTSSYYMVQSNLVIKNVLIRNKLVIRNHFPWPIFNLLHKYKEHLALGNNFRVTKKFLITKFALLKAKRIKTKLIRLRKYLPKIARKRPSFCPRSNILGVHIFFCPM